ncbi:MAG: hypothetical protein HAW58_04690 [Candidatus Thioglobus sp.]|nr:hypothetical protein [Candidatus Thioglobus sp.]
MKQGIPAQIQLFKFANKGLVFSQKYQVSDFPRISDLASNSNGLVEVELNFGLENKKIPCIKGQIKLDLSLICQRCLDGVMVHLEPDFNLAFLQNEQQGENLDDSFETILNADEEFSTIEFLTDEILICVPMIPLHQHKCGSYKNPKVALEKPENPFAILKKLKN